MPAQTTRSPWDFSDAFPILRGPPDLRNHSQRHAPAISAKSDAESTPQRHTNGLGDFSKIYEYLKNTTDPSNPVTRSLLNGKPASELDVPDPNRPPPPGPSIKDDAYASDGAVYTKKNVRFNDDTDVYEATDALDSPTSDDILGPSSPSKKKSKREKKAALKEKKKAINAAKIPGEMEKKQIKALRLKSASDVDSEADIGKLKKSTPARKASVHSQLPATSNTGTSQHQYNLRSTVVSPNTLKPNAPLASAPIPIPSVSTTGASNKSKKKVAQASSADSSPAKSFQHSSVLSDNLLPGPITPKTKKTKNKAPVTPQPVVSLEHNNGFLTSLQYSLPPTLQPSASISTSPKQAKRQVPRSFSLNSLLEQTIASNEATAAMKKTKLSKIAVNSLLPVTRRPTVSFSANERFPRLEIPAERMHSSPQGWQFPQYQEPGRLSQPAFNFFHQHHDALVHPLPFYMPVPRPRVNTFFSGAPTFTIYSKEDRDLQLFFRLLHDFGESKKALAQPVHLANHTSSPSGIHVFVDFSNIWIGFMEHLKYLPKPPGLRIPHQNLSFDSLVLLLERRRPVGKRVLAGSLPLLPAMELAKAIGYETNILDKVYKARELSEKQKRYAVVNALRRGNSASAVPTNPGNDIVTSGNASSGTGTCVPTAIPLFNRATGAVLNDAVTLQAPAHSAVQMSAEKWVEQGVDEILHLKILESIVDTDEPSTMVVATGDAAKAEYSEGFMKMIVRALKKGWKVELVAWGKSISMDYRRPDFTNMWAGRFRIIELDQYAEFLLDT